ncbi:uncharacterized protein LOC144128735 isoform X1 [Amblyomma americanum]
MEQPASRGIQKASRPRRRNRRRTDQSRECAASSSSFTRHTADNEALSASSSNGLLAVRGTSASNPDDRAGQQNTSSTSRRIAAGETRGGRGCSSHRDDLGSRGQGGGGRPPPETLPASDHREELNSPDATRSTGSDGQRDNGCQDGSSPAGRPRREDADRRVSFPFRGGRCSTTRAVQFPSFTEVTAAGMYRRDEVGPASEKSIPLYVYDCYLHALSTSTRATLGRFRVVPDRGLGRMVSSSSCQLPSLRGMAVAFCDPENEYICYGEVLTQGTEHVALLYDSVGVTSEQESHEFYVANLNVDGSCFISHLTALGSKSPCDLKRVEALLSCEMRQSLDVGLEVDRDHAAMQSAARALQYNTDETVSVDKSQTAAVKAMLTSDRSVLIHAPSGTGDKELLKAAIHWTLSVDVAKRHGPVLVAGSELAHLFKDDLDGVCDLDAEIGNAASAFEESASCIESKARVSECVRKMSEALQELCSLKTTIIHQSRFEGIPREFASKRNEERNCIEKWLFYGISRNEMQAAVSAADFNKYRKHCKFKINCGAPSSRGSIALSNNSAPQASKTAKSIPASLKSVYIWKTLQTTRTDYSDGESTNFIETERRHRWQLYKRWLRSLEENVFQKLEDAQNELMHCNLRCNKMLSERVTSPASRASVIVSTVATAVTHATVTDEVQPKALVLFRAHQFPAHLAASLFSQSMTKLILIGDNLCPQIIPTSSLWSFAFNSQAFELHELSLQPLLSQPVCNLLAPFTRNVMQSCTTAEAVKGVAEQAQFFDIPDEDEAFSVMSRLCLHLQTHGYEPGDVAVVSLAPNAGASTPALVQKLRHLRCAHVVWDLKTFYPRWCKILILYVANGSLGADLVAALTRARCAVYGFGKLANADEGCQNVFNTLLENRQRSVPSLNVSCVRHPGAIIRIESARDFERKFQVTGACNEPCGVMKPCGHPCVDRCHEGEHPEPCFQPCLKTVCSRKHSCLNRCYERCTQHCRVEVTATLPYCAHTATFPCYKWDTSSAQSPSRDGPHQYKCEVLVTVKRDCGHTVTFPCYKCDTRSAQFPSRGAPHKRKCTVPVNVNRKCGHRATFPCYEWNTSSAQSPSGDGPHKHKCTVAVNVKRDCGHWTKVSCFEFQPVKGLRTSGRLDQLLNLPPCRENVQVTSPCGHSKTMMCCNRGSYECDVSVIVERSCGHSYYVSCGADRIPPPLCTERVLIFRGCGHMTYRECSKTAPSKCTAVVKRTLACGHTVDVVCGSATPRCRVVVSKILACGHVEVRVCHDNSSPCTRPCSYQMRCSHFCNLRCGEHPHADKCESCKDKCCVS